MSTTLAPTATPGAGPGRTSTAPEHARHASRAVSAAGVVRSEWIKLRSVRSSTTTLLATAGVMLLFGALAAAVGSGLLATPPDAGGPDGGPGGGGPTATVLAGSLLAPLVIGVLGVLTITSEYATGTIRSTMTFVPGRLPVLGAKVVVLTAVVLPVMVVATLATFFLGQLLLGAGDAPTAAIGDPGVLRALLGTAAYLTGVALLGLALGTLLRSTAAAVSALVALVFLLPGLGGFLLPASWQEDVLVHLPSNAASSFTSVAQVPGALSPTGGALVFAAWVVIPLLLAAVALRRRAV